MATKISKFHSTQYLIRVKQFHTHVAFLNYLHERINLPKYTHCLSRVVRHCWSKLVSNAVSIIVDGTSTHLETNVYRRSKSWMNRFGQLVIH